MILQRKNVCRNEESIAGNEYSLSFYCWTDAEGGLFMRRITGLLLALVMVFFFSAALAQRAECPVGGFSVNLPDHFTEKQLDDADQCFHWEGTRLSIRAYAEWQGEVSELFQVLTGNETDYGSRNINGMKMDYIRTDEGGETVITYTWLDRGNMVTMEFRFAQGDSTALNTANSVISSIRFDAGH